MKLYIDTTNIMCFYTDICEVDVHYHSCYQIVISTKSTYNSIIEEKQYLNLKGFIIDKYTKHSCSASYGSFLVYYVESRSFLGKQIKKILNKEKFIDIETFLPQNRFAKLSKDFSKQKLSITEMKKLSDDLLHDIFCNSIHFVPNQKIDERISKAISYINNNIGNNLTLEKVADHIFLSPERTRHLFLENAEVPFSQFVLWARIKAVLISTITNKQSFYDAALQYGFNDQAHFNRFFKRMFGISPTIKLSKSQFIQFIYPEL